MKISNNTVKFLFDEEGNAEKGAEISKKSIVKDTTSAYGEYLDSKGYSTTGIGMLVSQNTFGSKKYLQDKVNFEKEWSTRLNKPINVKNIDKDTAYEMKAAYIQDKLLSKQGKKIFGGVDITTLPDSVQTSLISLAFNLGGLGPITQGLIRDFDVKRDRASLNALADEVENYHGSHPDGILLGKRRKREADLIRSETLNSIETEQPIPYKIERTPSNETLVEEKETSGNFVQDIISDTLSANEKEEVQPTNKQKSVDLGDQLGNELTIKDKHIELGRQLIGRPSETTVEKLNKVQETPEGNLQKPIYLSDVAPNTFPESIRDQLKAQKEFQDKYTGDGIIDSIAKFSEHTFNALVTENLVGQAAVKHLAFDNNVGEADPNFDPSTSKSWETARNFVRPEHMGDLFRDVINENDMKNRLSQYMLEDQTRREVGEYMSFNPVSGFVGIGLASVLDVTSLIPVGAIGKVTGISKMALNMSKTSRYIGGAVLENLVQDMTQEALLTANSSIRQFEDGDMIYGAIGGVLLGGAAGKFRGLNAERKFVRMGAKYASERNLTMLDKIISRAASDNYSPAVKARLNQMKVKLEQNINNEIRSSVSEALDTYSSRYKQTYLDNKKIDIQTKQEAFELEVDNQIQSIRNQSKSRISEVKEKHKAEKSAARKPINDLNERIQGLRNRIRSMKGHNTEAATKRKANLTKEISNLESKVNELNKSNKKLATRHKNELAKVVKEVEKMELSNNTNETIKLLEKSKKTNLDNLVKEYKALENSLNEGEGIPTPTDWDVKGFNEYLKELDVNRTFTSKDELDEFLGLKFKDSQTFRPIPRQSMGAAGTNLLTKSDEYITKGFDDSMNNFLNEGLRNKYDNPDYGLNYAFTNKDSTLGRLLRQTKLYEMFSEMTWFGRLANSINSLKNSDNPIAAGLANQMFSTKGGRIEGAGLAIEESTAKYRNIYNGTLKKELNGLIYNLKPQFKTNVKLQEALGLKGNNLDVFTVGGADFEAAITKLVRDELLDNGISQRLYGDEVAKEINKYIDKRFKLMNDINNTARSVGVEGLEAIKPDRNYFHRSWDNESVRAFIKTYGPRALIELVQKGLVSEFASKFPQGLPQSVLDDLSEAFEKEAKDFAYGLVNADLRTFQKNTDSFSDFLNRLENGNWDGIIDMKKFKEKASAELEALEKARKEILANRKKLDLNSSITLETPQGNIDFKLSDLLHSNLLSADNDFINFMVPRIAYAEKGITDISKVDDMIEAAAEWSTSKGDRAAGDYIRDSFKKVQMGIRNGGVGPTDGDEGVRKALSLVKKYNYARLMQYTGISSMSEMGMVPAEAGYKATYDAISHEIHHWYRTRKLSGATAEELRDELTETLGALTGVGWEGFNYAATRSTQSQIYKTGIMSKVEKGIDNMARVTHGTTSWLESANRRITINALAQDMSSVLMGHKSTRGYLGGLSDFNLVELGLATRVNGKVEYTDLFREIERNIKANALDVDGNLASKSGKRVVSFNFDNWEVGSAKKFGDVLYQRSNHVLVNPDVSTQSLWHTSLIGSIINQFKSFSQAAHAKVAMHNLNASVEAVKNREAAELIKGVHKLVAGAIFGKISLMTYSAIHNLGRDDYEERMAEAMSMNDFRDWSKALGRGSVLTGLDSAIDTGIGIVNTFNDRDHQIEAMFNNVSTIGQSRNALNLGTTATGQIVTGALSVGQHAAKGDFSKAANKAINLTPIRRTIGVNQLLNMMGVD